jgi:7-cyano-7-deazaguanine reductase
MPQRVDAGLLFPLPRAPQRQSLGLGGVMPFVGADLWCAYELSWLNERGKPQVAIAEIIVPCDSPNLVESKSLKLYLNGFANERFADVQAVRDRIRADLSRALWGGGAAPSGAMGPKVPTKQPAPAASPGPLTGTAGVRLRTVGDFADLRFGELEGLSLDRLDVDCESFEPDAALLRCDAQLGSVDEVLVSDLLRSLCPVTGQPDWGSVRIAYRGAPIDQEGLLRYLVGFRNHSGFHEHCVERIFADVWTRCRPDRLSVLARYTRRGGIDISPWRTSHPQVMPPFVRTARQ